MSDPLVSVVMCSYNTTPSFLNEAILSILNQTYQNIEFIIVDDNSSVPVDISLYSDNRIKLIRNNINLGPGLSRNKAIEFSKGKYIAIMDSDDISYPIRIEKQVEFMEKHPNTGIAGSWFKFFGAKDHIVETFLSSMDEYKCHLLFNNSPTLLNPSTIIRKEVLERYNISFGNTRYAEDYFLWVKASSITQIDIIPEVLVSYRCHNLQLSNTKKDEFINNKKDVYRYQFTKIGLDINGKDLDNFYKANNREKFNLKCYKKIIDLIVLKNNEVEYFSKDILNKIVSDNWYMMIRRIKNPFKLLRLLFLDKTTKSLVLKSINHRFKRIY